MREWLYRDSVAHFAMYSRPLFSTNNSYIYEPHHLRNSHQYINHQFYIISTSNRATQSHRTSIQRLVPTQLILTPSHAHSDTHSNYIKPQIETPYQAHHDQTIDPELRKHQDPRIRTSPRAEELIEQQKSSPNQALEPFPLHLVFAANFYVSLHVAGPYTCVLGMWDARREGGNTTPKCYRAGFRENHCLACQLFCESDA